MSFETLGAELLESLWQGEDTDFAGLAVASAWIRQLIQTAVSLIISSGVGLRKLEPAQLRLLREQIVKQASDATARSKEILATLDLDLVAVFGVAQAEQMPFKQLTGWVRLWLENLERLDEWSQLQAADAALRDLAGAEVADAFGSGGIWPEQIRSTIRYIHAESIYRRFASSGVWATNLTAAEKADLAANFSNREKARRASVARLIRGEHLARLPRGGMGAIGLVRGEIGKNADISRSEN